MSQINKKRQKWAAICTFFRQSQTSDAAREEQKLLPVRKKLPPDHLVLPVKKINAPFRVLKESQLIAMKRQRCDL